MTSPEYQRPAPGEFAEFFAGYVAMVPQGNLLEILEQSGRDLVTMLRGVPEARGDFAYAPGKWTLKEVIGHVSDTERVFSYRAVRIARGDTVALPGFDENAWVPNSGAAQRTLGDLLDEFEAVRAASVALFRSLPREAVARRGTASNREITVRAIAYITAGHPLHHARIIREKYLG